MSTTLSIISAAYRELNLISIAQAPTTAQTEEALSRLQSLVSSAYGFEVGGNQLVDWPVGELDDYGMDVPSWGPNDWTNLEADIRVVIAGPPPWTDSTNNLNFPEHPGDGSRIALIDPQGLLATTPLSIYGNGRTITGVTTITLNTATPQLWFYRADIGDWTSIGQLVDPTVTPTAQFPFPAEFDDYFITALAVRLAPRYGRAMPAESLTALDRSLEQLRARYHQKVWMPADEGVLALTRGYGRWRTYGWPTAIVRGRARWQR